MRTIIFTLVLLTASPVFAIPVTWTLDGVTLEEDLTGLGLGLEYRSLTGSFVYDAATNTYSDIFIQSQTGDYLWFGSTYTGDNHTNWGPALESPSNGGIILNDAADCGPGLICNTSLSLVYGAALTNAGGTIALSGQEDHVELYLGLGGSRYIISGNLTAVPIPATAWLFGSALAGLGWLRRKQTV